LLPRPFRCSKTRVHHYEAPPSILEQTPYVCPTPGGEDVSETCGNAEVAAVTVRRRQVDFLAEVTGAQAITLSRMERVDLRAQRQGFKK
jgi:hypothetical protein